MKILEKELAMMDSLVPKALSKQALLELLELKTQEITRLKELILELKFPGSKFLNMKPPLVSKDKEEEKVATDYVSQEVEDVSPNKSKVNPSPKDAQPFGLLKLQV
jgi:hypothetical protein